LPGDEVWVTWGAPGDPDPAVVEETTAVSVGLRFPKEAQPRWFGWWGSGIGFRSEKGTAVQISRTRKAGEA